MASEEPPTVPSALHVNEATLELLERRIEARVKAGFFKSVGAPVGLAGVAAIVYTLFAWIPANVSSYLERDPAFKSALQRAAEDYLRDPERGQQFVRQQIELTARAQIPPAVAEQVRGEIMAYFGSAEGRRLVTAQVRESVGAYFQTAGQAAIREQVAGHLGGDEVKQLIRDQVRRELSPGVAGLLEPVMKNSLRQVSLVLDLEAALFERRPDLIDKSSIEELRRQLDSPRGHELRRGDQPIAMTKRIRRGPVFDLDVIDLYLEALEQRFGSRFRHVVIMDTDGSFLARIEPGLFRQGLAAARGELMRVLNASAAEITPATVKKELNRLFGVATDAAIAPGVTMRDALRDPLWRRAPAGEVAVLREGGRFIGTTTHARLLAAVLGPLGRPGPS